MQGAVVIDSFTVALRASDPDDVVATTASAALGRLYATVTVSDTKSD
jgi:hypothetical protein